MRNRGTGKIRAALHRGRVVRVEAASRHHAFLLKRKVFEAHTRDNKTDETLSEKG